MRVTWGTISQLYQPIVGVWSEIAAGTFYRVHSVLEKSLKMLEFGIKTSRPLNNNNDRLMAFDPGQPG